ncbi:hypothetical protein [Thermaerobacter marianensis]|uniref:hypothetical protein n=1 Tax=Thermaerobacter marianensis TaxID=73919 RepID=UPI00069377A4|nr:hypothetical protein [Thermaerobacter marianensis]
MPSPPAVSAPPGRGTPTLLLEGAGDPPLIRGRVPARDGRDEPAAAAGDPPPPAWAWAGAAGTVLATAGLYLGLAAGVRHPGAPPQPHAVLVVGLALPTAGMALQILGAAARVSGATARMGAAVGSTGTAGAAAAPGRATGGILARGPRRPLRRFVPAAVAVAGYFLAAATWLGWLGPAALPALGQGLWTGRALAALAAAALAALAAGDLVAPAGTGQAARVILRWIFHGGALTLALAALAPWEFAALPADHPARQLGPGLFAAGSVALAAWVLVHAAASARRPDDAPAAAASYTVLRTGIMLALTGKAEVPAPAQPVILSGLLWLLPGRTGRPIPGCRPVPGRRRGTGRPAPHAGEGTSPAVVVPRAEAACRKAERGQDPARRRPLGRSLRPVAAGVVAAALFGLAHAALLGLTGHWQAGPALDGGTGPLMAVAAVTAVENGGAVAGDTGARARHGPAGYALLAVLAALLGYGAGSLTAAGSRWCLAPGGAAGGGQPLAPPGAAPDDRTPPSAGSTPSASRPPAVREPGAPPAPVAPPAPLPPGAPGRGQPAPPPSAPAAGAEEPASRSQPPTGPAVAPQGPAPAAPGPAAAPVTAGPAAASLGRVAWPTWAGWRFRSEAPGSAGTPPPPASGPSSGFPAAPAAARGPAGAHPRPGHALGRPALPGRFRDTVRRI